jgi:glucokinase
MPTFLTSRCGAGSNRALPGPFDYRQGIGLYHGVGKFETLCGVNLRGRSRLPRCKSVTFLNDANAFLLGEWWAGAAQDTAVLLE